MTNFNPLCLYSIRSITDTLVFTANITPNQSSSAVELYHKSRSSPVDDHQLFKMDLTDYRSLSLIHAQTEYVVQPTIKKTSTLTTGECIRLEATPTEIDSNSAQLLLRCTPQESSCVIRVSHVPLSLVYEYNSTCQVDKDPSLIFDNPPHGRVSARQFTYKLFEHCANTSGEIDRVGTLFVPVTDNTDGYDLILLSGMMMVSILF
jgi:hypothetical protein